MTRMSDERLSEIGLHMDTHFYMYGDMVTELLAALKAERQELEAAKTTLKDLKAENERLEAEVKDLDKQVEWYAEQAAGESL